MSVREGARAEIPRNRDFPPYADLGEFGIYVAAAAQGRGVGRRLLESLCDAAERDGLVVERLPGPAKEE